MAKLIVTTSHPAPYKRRVAVYVPRQYQPGTEAPFIVGADGPDKLLFTALDNLIAQKRVPVMIASRRCWATSSDSCERRRPRAPAARAEAGAFT